MEQQLRYASSPAAEVTSLGQLMRLLCLLHAVYLVDGYVTLAVDFVASVSCK